MSKSEIYSENNFYKINNENIDIKINEKDDFNKINNLEDNEIDNVNIGDKNIDNENYNNEINNIKNNQNNYSFDDSDTNSIFRECFNYYLSYFYEQDFTIPEEEEPKNANFFYRLFGNYPKIYQILPELKSERNFIIFLKRNNISKDDEMFKKIFGRILKFIETNLSDINIDEDKIAKKCNPENLLKKSYNLLKEKRLSYTNMVNNKSDSKDLLEEYNINSIPILMLLQMLYIIEKFPNFIESFVSKCFPDEKEIILAFSFYLSSIAFDRLLSGRLNLYFNKGKNVLDAYIEFYLGLFDLSFDLLESKKNIYHDAFLGIESEAQNMPSSIFWKTKTFKLKYPEIKSESSLTSYFNNSSMNQK